mmetsp:Transcript_46198/g.116338  ORF Transcript_46198/g.116338 Transcript_46198/m.116338 type:complete len:229 (-) Transcript_46198:408-1094(-)
MVLLMLSSTPLRRVAVGRCFAAAFFAAFATLRSSMAFFFSAAAISRSLSRMATSSDSKKWLSTPATVSNASSGPSAKYVITDLTAAFMERSWRSTWSSISSASNTQALIFSWKRSSVTPSGGVASLASRFAYSMLLFSLARSAAKDLEGNWAAATTCGMASDSVIRSLRSFIMWVARKCRKCFLLSIDRVCSSLARKSILKPCVKGRCGPKFMKLPTARMYVSTSRSL